MSRRAVVLLALLALLLTLPGFCAIIVTAALGGGFGPEMIIAG